MGRMAMDTVNRGIWGFFLIAVGAMLLAVNLGVDLPHRVWSYWPFLLIAMGTAKLALGARDGCGDGFWLLLGGLYGWISIWHLWGLSWSTAWPIFVIAGGLSVLLKPALARRHRPDGRNGAPASAAGVDHAG